MSKKNIKLIIILVIIVIALGTSFFFYKTNQTAKNNIAASIPQDILNKDEQNELNLYHLGIYEAVSRDDKGKVTAYKFLGLKDAKEISLELMSDDEKLEKHIPTSAKIQVLDRDAKGKIIVYRVIKTDADIISKY